MLTLYHSLIDLSITSGRSVRLSVPSLYGLDTDANGFNKGDQILDDAVLLTRNNTRHALRRYINSEVINKGHFFLIIV